MSTSIITKNKYEYGNKIDISSIGHGQCYKPPIDKHTIY
ncbi:hypothetical protein SLEP1_g53409 [Rubroshorea leprosula]|uniref:Uncharacterized protein n=1 Tax=Rubroshorea leprosula TaxID=152421 RepID=A0AAV5MB45_9ROSI|nr:hypothetical protein SLEP1_g53409 [Rubroshorea leprosula]